MKADPKVPLTFEEFWLFKLGGNPLGGFEASPQDFFAAGVQAAMACIQPDGWAYGAPMRAVISTATGVPEPDYGDTK